MQTCSHQMTATSVIHTVNPDHLSLRVSIAKPALPAVILVIIPSRRQARAMLQTATCIQPISGCPSRQLHHAFRPASTQLQRLRSCPPLKASQATPPPTIVTAAAGEASKAASDNASRVKAAFIEAGLCQDAVDYILKQYPAYRRWNVEQKLLPAMQRRQQELGARFSSEFRRVPTMLLRSPEVIAEARSVRKAAKVKAAGDNAVCVKAAFAEAHLSQDAIDHILTQYPRYLGWDVEQKLLPAIQQWQQELGDSFIPEFQKLPTLLNRKPEEEQLKDQYLASIGIRSPTILRAKNPYIFRQSLASMQSKVAVLQQRGFTRAQTLSLIEQHSGILQCSMEHVKELPRVIGDMFGCADKDALCAVMLSCRRVGVFTMSATSCIITSYICTCLKTNDKEMRRAWKHGVFRAPPAEVDIRLHSIAAQLDSTLDEAKAVVRSMPQILILLPETVGLHVPQLLGLGFSHGQVKSMCLQKPFLLTLNFSSDVHVAKWVFLTYVLRLSHDIIAVHPSLLMASLPNRLGPRWEYLQQLRLHGVIAFTAAPQVFNSLVFMTDSKFTEAYSTPQLRLYDDHFQKQWQQNWDSLLVDQQLSIQDIGGNPAFLHISLKDT